MKLVITGYGIVSTVGVGNEAFERGLSNLDAQTATKPSSDATGAPLIREIPDFDPTPWLGEKGLRSLDRGSRARGAVSGRSQDRIVPSLRAQRSNPEYR